MLSLVVPTLNAEAGLARMLETVRAGVDDIVVADGGSTDRTLAIPVGTRIVACPPGRGTQLAAGAAAAGGDWLLFLHADTVLATGWREEADRHMRESPDRAAVFRLAFDDSAAAAERVARLANWRARTFGLPYGDQGLLISRRLYDAVGGFRPLPLMEDVDLVRRLGRSRLAFLETAAVTSAERYRRDGWLRRPARNLFCLGLYFLGLPPPLIAKIYRSQEVSRPNRPCQSTQP
ncbi:MAG: TIGR04283 family arsenosugar biosynthesis glycosyltransferase [Magnetospirillum sp. WYHS-4]